MSLLVCLSSCLSGRHWLPIVKTVSNQSRHASAESLPVVVLISKVGEAEKQRKKEGVSEEGREEGEELLINKLS